jgi:hypothetical protein
LDTGTLPQISVQENRRRPNVKQRPAANSTRTHTKPGKEPDFWGEEDSDIANFRVENAIVCQTDLLPLYLNSTTH